MDTELAMMEHMVDELEQQEDATYYCKLDIPEGRWRMIPIGLYDSIKAKRNFGGLVLTREVKIDNPENTLPS